MTNLLNVDHALEQILDKIAPLGDETISLEDGLARVLAEEIVSLENVPPFPASAVDGFGVRVEDALTASPQSPVTLQVVMDVQAGMSPSGTLGEGQAARIMTGAVVPDGVTAVIPVEDSDGDWRHKSDHVRIFTPATQNMNIRPIGENIREGQRILSSGTRIRPQEIGILAALGHSRLRVIKRPRVVVISTGDELVTVAESVPPGKIRDVNGYTLSALLHEFGAEVITLPIVRDSSQEVRDAFETALTYQPDMVISTGGVSVGAVDFVRDILQELGEINFWRINLRPGKPLAFGALRGVPFFGLPGNPVSAMVTFDVMVRPALEKLAGKRNTVPMREAMLKKSVKSDGRRTYLRVKLEYNEGVLVADPSLNQSSGALMSMVEADGLLILPEGLTEALEGEVYPVRLLREEE